MTRWQSRCDDYDDDDDDDDDDNNGDDDGEDQDDDDDDDYQYVITIHYDQMAQSCFVPQKKLLIYPSEVIKRELELMTKRDIVGQRRKL